MFSSIKSAVKYYKLTTSILDSKQKRDSVLVFLCIFVSSFFEMLGVSIMIPYISVIISPEKLLKYEFINDIVNRFNISPHIGLVSIMSIAVIMVYLIKNLFLVLSDYVGLRYEASIQKDMAVLMLRSYLSRDYEDMLDVNTAEAYRGLTTDVTGIYYIIQSFFQILSKGVTILLICGFLFFTDPVFAISLGIVGGLLALTIIFKLKNRISEYGKVFNQTMFETTKNATQSLGGLKEITVMGRNSIFLKNYDDAINRQMHVQVNYRFLQAFPTRLIEMVFVIGIMLVIALKALSGSDLSLIMPQLAAIAMGALRIMPYISGISSHVGTILYYIPSLNNACENIIAAREYTKERSIKEWNDSDKGASFDKELKLDKIRWKYRSAADYTIDGLSMTVKKGETIGIVGGSGAGKTTVADIVLGLLKPSEGNILLDNIDMEKIGSNWASVVGYVPQNIYLLDDSIRNNILFGLPDCKDDEKILKILEKVNLKDFVLGLPDGLETIVGERGVKFSGGQRQRIAIARVLYYNPELIVLDEATSALDNDTERAVMEAIEGLHGEKTLLIIAHRITSLKNCDRIIRIENGKAVETDYEQLVK